MDSHGAISDSKYKLAKFLIACGLDIAESSAPQNFKPVQLCLFRESWSAHLPWLLTCLQSSEAAANTDVVDVWTFLHRIDSTTCSTFETFQPAMQPDFYASPLPERARTYLSTVRDANLFRKILHRDGVIRKEDVVELVSSNVNVLSIAARCFVSSYLGPFNTSEWGRLMRELILLTDDHSAYSKDYKFTDKTGRGFSVNQGTVLWACVYSIGAEEYIFHWLQRRNEPIDKYIRIRIFRWLKWLQECNVDLLGYGQREHEIIFGGAHKRHEIRVLRTGSWMWTGFSWGPNPEDWTFHLDRVVERFAGDFWHMVDNPDLRVPGAWIDDDRPREYRDYYSVIDSDESGSETESESED